MIPFDIEKDGFDVVLMDMQMPVMDGVTATQTLRKKGCTLPIIPLTADAVGDAQAKCLAAGCSHYLSKPIEMEALSALLAEIIGSEKLAEPDKREANEAGPVPAVPTLSPPTATPAIAAVTEQPVSIDSTTPKAGTAAETVTEKFVIDRDVENATEERLAIERAVAAKAVEKATAEMLRAEKMAAEMAAAEKMRAEAVAEKAAAEADVRRAEVDRLGRLGPDIIPDLPMDDADFRSIAEDHYVLVARLFKCRAHCTDTPVHHVTWSNDVRTGVGLCQGHLH